jgi:hypothetical protein
MSKRFVRIRIPKLGIRPSPNERERREIEREGGIQILEYKHSLSKHSLLGWACRVFKREMQVLVKITKILLMNPRGQTQRRRRRKLGNMVGQALLKKCDSEQILIQKYIFAFGLSAKLMPKALELLFPHPTHPPLLLTFFF